MTPDEFTDLYEGLLAAYPNARTKVDAKTQAVYWAMLNDLDVADVRVAVRDHVARSQWFPTVADLRRVAVERRLDLPSLPSAYAQLDRWVMGQYDGVHPLVAAAALALGSRWDWRNTTHPGALKHRFASVYGQMRASRVDEENLRGVGLEAPPSENGWREMDGVRLALPEGSGETH